VINAVYDDVLTSLFSLGDVDIKRASHVEPQGKHWYADLRPVGGPVLNHFKTRQAALDAEKRYLLRKVVA
jgi:hypothetical protein